MGKPTVGVIGLGKMGLPITGHLLRCGYRVVGCDVTRAAREAASVLGATAVGTPRQVAAACDYALVVVGFDSEVERVLFADDGLVAAGRAGLRVAICATVAPGFMRALPGRLAGSGVELVDAPLCRGEPAAEAGALLVMGGGPQPLFDDFRPLFATFADSVFHLGELGAGQVGKMINNLILWACTVANDEGLRLGSALGVDEEALRLALVQSSAKNWSLEIWRDHRDMPWAEKDMNLVLKEADAARLALPLCGLVKEAIKGFKIARGLPMPVATPNE